MLKVWCRTSLNDMLQFVEVSWSKRGFECCHTTVLVDFLKVLSNNSSLACWLRSTCQVYRSRWYVDFGKQSCALSTDRIEIHQSQPLVWPSDLHYVMLAGGDWWISIRSVDNTQHWRKFWNRLRVSYLVACIDENGGIKQVLYEQKDSQGFMCKAGECPQVWIKEFFESEVKWMIKAYIHTYGFPCSQPLNKKLLEVSQGFMCIKACIHKSH